MSDLDAAFDIAAANSKNLIDDPQGDAQLELYAYHQQAQHGDNHAPQPDVNDAAALAKWAAKAGSPDDNTALANVCAQFVNCKWDNLATFNYKFTTSDVSTIDYFHPSLTGQNSLASTTWAAGYWPTTK